MQPPCESSARLHFRYPDNTETAGRHVAEQAKRMRCLNFGEPDFKCMLEASASLIIQTAVPPLFFPSFTGLIPFPPREMLQKEEASITPGPVTMSCRGSGRLSCSISLNLGRYIRSGRASDATCFRASDRRAHEMALGLCAIGR